MSVTLKAGGVGQEGTAGKGAACAHRAGGRLRTEPRRGRAAGPCKWGDGRIPPAAVPACQS